MLEFLTAISPIVSALIGVISYATLTNYRLDKLDDQVAKIFELEDKLNEQDKRITLLEVKINGK